MNKQYKRIIRVKFTQDADNFISYKLREKFLNKCTKLINQGFEPTAYEYWQITQNCKYLCRQFEKVDQG